MRDFLIALAILVIAGVYLVRRARKGGTKEERRRAKAIAGATVRRHEPMKNDAEQELADAWHEDVEKARTGEFPKILDEPRRPTVREVARKYRRPAKHSAKRLPKSKPAKTALNGPLPASLELPVMLPGAVPSIDIDSFTGEWEGSFNARKVGARR